MGRIDRRILVMPVDYEGSGLHGGMRMKVKLLSSASSVIVECVCSIVRLAKGQCGCVSVQLELVRTVDGARRCKFMVCTEELSPE